MGQFISELKDKTFGRMLLTSRKPLEQRILVFFFIEKYLIKPFKNGDVNSLIKWFNDFLQSKRT